MKGRGKTVAESGDGRRLWKRIVQNKWTYIFFLPTLIYLGIFSYAPFYGLQIAFKDYKIYQGIAASEWVGLKWFEMIITDPKIYKLLWNTVKISVIKSVFLMPAPIIFAILLTEAKGKMFKKSVQTITYFPNFLSWVVFGGIVYNFTGPYGVFNQILTNMGMDPVNLVTNPDAFIPMLVITELIKNVGYSSIVYMAAIAGVDEQLYEAAAIDGAGRLRQIWHVMLPGIRPMICFSLCMSVSGVLNAGFEQILIFLNQPLYEVGDVLDTYIFRLGLGSGEYELSTAAGLLKGIVGTTLLVIANTFSRKVGERSVW